MPPTPTKIKFFDPLPFSKDFSKIFNPKLEGVHAMIV